MDNEIKLSKHIYFNVESCRFYLENSTSEIIYRSKNVICSYSGSNEWAHHFMCEMIDLYSGCSIYNYALGCYQLEKRIPELIKDNKKDLVINYIKDRINDDWFQKACLSIDFVIDNLVEV